MKHTRSCLALLTTLSLTLSACGGGNNSAGPAPNTGNIPNLSQRPTPQAEAVKTQRFSGKVFDAVSGKPIEDAVVWIHILSLADPPKTNNNKNNQNDKNQNNKNDNKNNQNDKNDNKNNRDNNQENENNTEQGNTNPEATPTPDPNNPDATPDPNDPNANPSIGPDGTPIGPDGNPLPPGVNPDGTPIDPNAPPSIGPDGNPVGPDGNPLSPGEGPPQANAPIVRVSMLANTRANTQAAFQLAQNNRANQNKNQNQNANAPNKDNDSPNSYRTTSNNQGQFWVDDVPDGTHMLTVVAPEYRMLTIVKVNPAQMDIPLIPLGEAGTTDVTGMVLSPSESPVENAMVSISSRLGDPTGVPSSTNTLGEFLLPQVPFGKHGIMAFVMDNNYKIKQMGLEKFIQISDKSLKSKTPVFPGADATPMPTAIPSSDPEYRKQLEQNVENMLKEKVDPGSAENIEKIPQSPLTPGQTPEAEPTASADAIPLEERGIVVPDTPSAEDIPVEERTGVENEEEGEGDEEAAGILNTLGNLIRGENPEDGVKEGSVYPVITLHSVLNMVTLSGKVNLPDGFQLKNIEIYLVEEGTKTQRGQEFFLFSRPFATAQPEAERKLDQPDSSGTAEAKEKEPNKDQNKEANNGNKDKKQKANAKPEGPQNFALELPALEENQTYHLQFTAISNETGSILYKHLYELTPNTPEIDVQMMPAPGGIEIEGEEDNAIPIAPRMAWDDVNGAQYYRVQIEAGTRENSRIIWEAWTTEPRIEYPLRTLPGRLMERELYRLTVAALKGVKPQSKDQELASAHPAFQAIWTDLTQTSHGPFEVVDLTN